MSVGASLRKTVHPSNCLTEGSLLFQYTGRHRPVGQHPPPPPHPPKPLLLGSGARDPDGPERRHSPC